MGLKLRLLTAVVKRRKNTRTSFTGVAVRTRTRASARLKTFVPPTEGRELERRLTLVCRDCVKVLGAVVKLVDHVLNVLVGTARTGNRVGEFGLVLPDREHTRVNAQPSGVLVLHIHHVRIRVAEQLDLRTELILNDVTGAIARGDSQARVAEITRIG